MVLFVEYLPGEKHASTNPERSDTHESFRDCGLLISDNECVVDIDHLPKESIRAMLSTFHIKTQVVWTERGAHLYFKKALQTRATEGVCRLGFKVEIHTKKTRPNGMTIKRNGILREIENEGMMMQIPSIFTVGYKVKKKNCKFEDLTGMDDGDGRNTKLYNHRLNLAKCENWERIITFINEYVFSTPMSGDEMKSILREDVEANEGTSNQETLVVRSILAQCKPVMYHGSLWWYKAGQYIDDSTYSEMRRRVYSIDDDLKTSYVDEVIKQVTYKVKEYKDDAVFPIRFKNGIIDSGEFLEMEEFTDFTPYYVDIDYDENATPVKIVDDYIHKLTYGDDDYKRYLFQVLGFGFITDPERIRSLGKFFIFRGDGANGKGTLFKIMQRIYGSKNCSALTIKQLCDPRQATSMIGKLANLGDDIEPETINDDQLKMLKNISTCDTISMRKLYQEAFTTAITTKLYFTSNHTMKSYDKGFAFQRRIVWLPMFIKVDKPDPMFITKLTTPEALRYWIKLIVDGYMDLYQNSWCSCKRIEEYNESYHEENNSMMLFAKSLNLDDDILGRTIKNIGDTYREWDSDDSKFSAKLFKQAVWELHKAGLGICKVNGKTSRVFMLQEETTQSIAP